MILVKVVAESDAIILWPLATTHIMSWHEWNKSSGYFGVLFFWLPSGSRRFGLSWDQ